MITFLIENKLIIKLTLYEIAFSFINRIKLMQNYVLKIDKDHDRFEVLKDISSLCK